jgi:hypothetical protein
MASFYILSYLPIAILAGMLVIYDLRTRRRVHPVVAAAILFGVTNNWTASVAYELPVWKSIATRLLGHSFNLIRLRFTGVEAAVPHFRHL